MDQDRVTDFRYKKEEEVIALSLSSVHFIFPLEWISIGGIHVL